MRYSFAGVGMIMFGLISFVIVLVFQDITVNNEADYYSLKEAMEASMYEAIDIAYYRNTTTDETPGEIKIIEEKFVANFTRRFVNNTMGNSQGYTVEFYDIMEKPPKASIKIVNNTNGMVISDSFDVVNNLTGIIEANVTPAITDDKCDEGEKLVIAKLDPLDYYVNFFISKKSASEPDDYNFYKLNFDRVKSAIRDKGIYEEIKSIWINNVKLDVNGILGNDVVIPENFQSSSYLMQGVNITDVELKNYSTCVNGDSDNPWHCVKSHSSSTVTSSCSFTNRIIPNFDINIIDSDGSRYGAPIIRILKALPEDVNIINDANSDGGTRCNQILKYQITWEYSYCSS